MFVIFFFLCFIVASSISSSCFRQTANCVPVTNLTCFGVELPYTHTSFDLTTHLRYNFESRRELRQWSALRTVPKCWSVIRPLLCAVYFPECVENHYENGTNAIRLVSQHLCKAIHGPCRVVPAVNSGEWPSFLRCNNTEIFRQECRSETRIIKFNYADTNVTSSEDRGKDNGRWRNMAGRCLDPLVKADKTPSFYPNVDECGLKCKSPIFTEDEYRKVKSFVAVGAGLSLTACLFAVFTFLIDWSGANKYPNLVIFNMNVCFVLVMLGWLSQFLSTDHDDVVCRSDGTRRIQEPGSGENFSCVVVFILIYYFGLAACIWFVILTYSWNLMFQNMASGRKVPSNQELLEKRSSYFHILAWSIPLILSIAVISVNGIEGNPLTGVCFVKRELYFYFAFVVCPLIVTIVISCYFIFNGLRALIGVQLGAPNEVITESASAQIRSTAIRIGVYCGINFICTAVTFAHTAYYFENVESWESSLRDYIVCVAKLNVDPESESRKCELRDRPEIFRIQLQLLCAFLSAIAASLWICTKNSVKSWSRFLREKIVGKRDISNDRGRNIKIRKHQLITQAFAKRQELANAGRLSLTFQSSHVDPVGMIFNNDSAMTSGDFSSTWAAALPRLVQRRGALVGAAAFGLGRRSSIDSDISRNTSAVSIRSNRFSWLGGGGGGGGGGAGGGGVGVGGTTTTTGLVTDSRRHSFDSQLSIPPNDLERLRSIYESTIRSKKSSLSTSKRKFFSSRTSSRLRNLGSRFSSRRGSLTSNNSSTTSQVLPAVTLDPRKLQDPPELSSTRKNRSYALPIPGQSTDFGVSAVSAKGGADFFELEEKLKTLQTSHDVTDDDEAIKKNVTATTILVEDDDDGRSRKCVSVQTSLTDLSGLSRRKAIHVKTIGTQYSLPLLYKSNITTDSSSQTDGENGRKTPLTHIEPNVIQIRVSSEDSSIPSSYERDFDMLLKPLTSSKWGDKENDKVGGSGGHAVTLCDTNEMRPIHNRGRRGAIVETSLKHLKEEIELCRVSAAASGLQSRNMALVDTSSTS